MVKIWLHVTSTYTSALWGSITENVAPRLLGQPCAGRIPRSGTMKCWVKGTPFITGNLILINKNKKKIIVKISAWLSVQICPYSSMKEFALTCTNCPNWSWSELLLYHVRTPWPPFPLSTSLAAWSRHGPQNAGPRALGLPRRLHTPRPHRKSVTDCLGTQHLQRSRMQIKKKKGLAARHKAGSGPTEKSVLE